MNRDQQFETRHKKVAKYWRQKSHKMWAALKHEVNSESETSKQYCAIRYYRRARRYRIRAVKNS